MSLRSLTSAESSVLGVRVGQKLFLLALVVAAAIRLVVISSVRPGTDVFYYDQQAAALLVSLQSPYGHHFTGIPVSLGTIGAENTFAYLPFTALYLIPFYFMGDVRFGFVVADIVIGITIYSFGGGRIWIPLLFWFLPFTVIFSTVYVNNSLVSLLFISLFVKFERSGRPFLGAISFGIALSAIQFAWLLLPAVVCYYLRTWRWRESAISVLLAIAIMAPFIVASPTTFYGNAINFQFTRPTLNLITNAGPLGYNINPTLNGFLVAFGSLTFPASVRLLISAALVPFFVFRIRDLQSFLIRATGFLLLTIFILPNDFFWAYVELPFVLLLFYASLVWQRRSWVSRSPRQASHLDPASLQVKPLLQTKT